MSSCAVLNSRWDIYSTPTPTRLKNHSRRGGQNGSKSQREKTFAERDFSRHDSEVAHMNSQWLGLQVQDLYKFKPAQIPTWMGVRLTKPHSYLRSFCQLVTVGGGRISFSGDAGPERLSILSYSCDVGLPSVCYKYVLLPLVIKKPVLANGLVEYISWEI